MKKNRNYDALAYRPADLNKGHLPEDDTAETMTAARAADYARMIRNLGLENASRAAPAPAA